ncbi:MAG: saccharopine dehydrogenase, partial [Anaerolineae bacterium]|nr:saccharopine dehydrogenase [Anaerolineae bacterium]
MTNFLIYGSYGYTGNLITKLAVERGHRPILAGRDEKKLGKQNADLGLPALAFDLSETQKLGSVLNDVDVALHCAGP